MSVRYLETLNTSTVSISCRAAKWGFFGGKPVEAQCAGAQFHTPSSSCQPWGGLGGRPSAGPPPQLPHIANLFHADEAFREVGKGRGHWLLCATVLPAPARCRPGPRLRRCCVSALPRSALPPGSPAPRISCPPRTGSTPAVVGQAGRGGRGSASRACARPRRVSWGRWHRITFHLLRRCASRRGNCRSSGGAQRACAGTLPDTHVLPRGGRAVPPGQDIPLTDTTHRLLFGVWTPAFPVLPPVVSQARPSYSPELNLHPGKGGRQEATQVAVSLSRVAYARLPQKPVRAIFVRSAPPPLPPPLALRRKGCVLAGLALQTPCCLRISDAGRETACLCLELGVAVRGVTIGRCWRAYTCCAARFPFL